MAAVRAVTAIPPTRVAKVLLHVTLSLVPSVSSDVRNIWLLAVTAVVLTVSAMLTVPVGIRCLVIPPSRSCP